MEFDITGNLKLNTQQAERQLNGFTQNMNIPLMNGNVNDVGPINGSTQINYQNTTEKMSDFNDVMSKVKDSFKDILGSMKLFSENLDDLDSKLPSIQKSRKDASSPTEQNKEIQSYQRGIKDVTGIIQAGSNSVQSIANGNIAGTVIGGLNGVGSTVGMMGMSDFAKSNGISKQLLGAAGGIAALTAILGAGNAMADAYGNSLDGQDLLLKSFGGEDINGNTARQNARLSLALRSDAEKAARGTGMELEDFIRLSSSLSQYGISDSTKAYNIANQSAMWNRYTGADTNQVANFAGMIERYGGDGAKMLQNAYGAARVSGLDKSQFGEFLTGLQTVVENGISKGFIKSADDVSEQLANISLLSGGNELWKGRQGIQRYEQIGSAMSNATSLNSTSSMLLYQAVANQKGNKGKDWVSIMSEIEKGNWGDPDFIKSYNETLNGAFGNDRDSKIATIKENFGLNYTGAIQLFDMFNNGDIKSPDEIKKEIERLQSDKTTKSDSASMVDALNKINDGVVQISRGEFIVKYGAEDKVGQILDLLEVHFGKKEEKKLERDNRIVGGVNYNNITGSSYSGVDKYGNYIITTNKNEISGDYAETPVNIETLKREAQNKNTTGAEIKAYNLAEKAIQNGVSKDVYQQFLNDYSAAIVTKGNKETGFVFDQQKLFAAIDKLLLAMSNVTATMEER